MTTVEEPPAYPLARGRCPMDPPPGLIDIQNAERVSRGTLWDGSSPWIVTGFDEVRAVLGDDRASANFEWPGYPHTSAGSAARRQIAKTIVNLDNPQHDQVRRALLHDFMAKRMELLRPRIQQLVDRLIDDMVAGPNPTDLVEALAVPLPSLVMCDMLGIPEGEQYSFNELSRTIISSVATPTEAVAALQAMLDFLTGLVDEKIKKPTDDIIGRLIVEQLEPGHWTKQYLVNTCQVLLLGGHETTGNMIALGTLALLEHPEVLAEVRASEDPKVIANTVEELLRWLTILHFGRRRVAVADMEVAGQTIRAGDGIVCATDAANRDPEAFPEPDTIDIHRRARHHLAFGFGIHQCLGQPLARVELQVVYGTLYRRIPSLRLAVDMKDVRFKNENIVYGVHELPVAW